METVNMPRPLNKVPHVAVGFWLLKLLTTGAGEASSDWIIKHFNQYTAVVVSVVVFAAIVFWQIRRDSFSTARYWLTVTMVAIFGTQVADVMHVGLGVPYAVSTAVCLTGVIGLFLLWRLVEGTVSMDHIDSTRRELFYWATIIATFALGTALGDYTAVTVKLGYGGSIFLFAAAFALPALWWAITRRGEIACFWLAYIVTRPLGASVADYLAMPHHRGGLNVGLGNISLVWLAFISLGVAVMARRAASVTA